MACGFVAAAAVKAAPHTPRTLCAHRFDALQEEVVAAALHGVPMAEEEEQVHVQDEEEEVSAATRLELDRLAELELLEVELDGLLRRSAAPAAALPRATSPTTLRCSRSATSATRCATRRRP